MTCRWFWKHGQTSGTRPEYANLVPRLCSKRDNIGALWVVRRRKPQGIWDIRSGLGGCRCATGTHVESISVLEATQSSLYYIKQLGFLHLGCDVDLQEIIVMLRVSNVVRRDMSVIATRHLECAEVRRVWLSRVLACCSEKIAGQDQKELRLLCYCLHFIWSEISNGNVFKNTYLKVYPEGIHAFIMMLFW